MLKKGRLLLPLISLCFGLSLAVADLRDPEAVYLDRISDLPPIILKVQTTAPVFASRSLTAHTANLIPGDEVRLLAHHPSAYLVRALRGRTEGWVSPTHLSEPPPESLKLLFAAIEEENRYQTAIQNKEVIAGMTFDHVLKALGKPDRKSFREDEHGRFDLWSYIEYETRTEQQPYYDTYAQRTLIRYIRVKVPVGSTEIEFKEGRVTAVQRTEPGASLLRQTPLR
jgi:hypothetical protein